MMDAEWWIIGLLGLGIIVIGWRAMGVWRSHLDREGYDEDLGDMTSEVTDIRRRLTELEDAYERHLKREAVRQHRQRKDETDETTIPQSRTDRLAELRARARQMGLRAGG